MILAFELSMPSAPSWNGRWSGEGRCYAKLETFRGAKGGKRAADHELKAFLEQRRAAAESGKAVPA